jgi:putative intracellular protease/amidase
MDMPLKGRKVAVLVESQYIPDEIRTYQQKFSAAGATVDLVSHLWGQKTLECISAVTEKGTTAETIQATVEVEQAKPEDYAAVIQSANYTSVRERFPPAAQNARLTPSMVRDAPAVKFFAAAMRNPRVIKGALCHGLWILTPVPELLANRRVICHAVVLADVLNAGGIYVHSDNGVVVDDDLVTGDRGERAGALADAIIAQVTERSKIPATQVQRSSARKNSNRRALILLSEWGYWGEELIGPLEVFEQAGYEVEFCTPTGKRPNAITVSMDPTYVDPPLGRSVTSDAVAAKTREIDDPSTSRGAILDKPRDLSAMMPQRPYWSAPQFVRGMERYNRERERSQREATDRYDVMLIVGGSGPVVDLVNNQRVHDLILGFYRAGKPIAAECYGVACLAFARDLEDRRSIIWGKHVTGHCLEYDYQDGTGFMEARGKFLNFNMGPPPYPLEYILRDATGPTGAYHGNFGKETSAIVDYPFITGRSTPDSYLTGKLVVDVLDGDPPLRRYGW